MLTSRRVTVLLLRNFRLHIRPRGCDGRAMPVGLIATTVRLIPSIRATSATRPARRDGREDRRYGSMPPRRFVTNFLPTPVGNLRRPEHPEDELLILNYHLPAVTPHLLRHTRRCFCADGGANPPVRRAPRDAPATRSEGRPRRAHPRVHRRRPRLRPTRGPALLRRRRRARRRPLARSGHDRPPQGSHRHGRPRRTRTRTRTRTREGRGRDDRKPPRGVASSSSARWAAGSITRCQT